MSTARLWAPCYDGAPDPEHCPGCLAAGRQPPDDQRCPEYRERWTGCACNGPCWHAPGRTVRFPCRVLGEHERHNDGLGTVWRMMTDAEAEELFGQARPL